MERAEIIKELKKGDFSEFEIKVLLATYSIPKGKTLTYKQIAEKIGHPNAYRAVGTALSKNPLAPIVPCHRVIKSDGSLGGFSSPGGTKSKEKLLKKEHALIEK